MNILFVCSRNQWRSPTAEALFKNDANHAVRSAGTSEKARVKISLKLIEWADLVFAMEKKHKEIILSKFNVEKEIIVLDIADEYEYMDTELIQMLKDATSPWIEANGRSRIS